MNEISYWKMKVFKQKINNLKKYKKSIKKVLTLNVKADIIILVLERGQENKK